MDIQLAGSDADLERLADVLLQLRPQYDRASLIDQIHQQQASDGYRVAFGLLDGRVACVAGFVIHHKLAWGRHLYVDDLVTADDRRSRGAGAAMIAWLKDFARAQGCRELHLDSGLHRVDAHRFYDREGFTRASLHFSMTGLDDDQPRDS